MPGGKNEVYPEPRAMSISDIAKEVEHYRQAALNAIQAGKLVEVNNYPWCLIACYAN